MNSNRYIDDVIGKYDVLNGPGTAVYEAGQYLRGLIQRWYSTRLVRVHNSGSFAKAHRFEGEQTLICLYP